jgi:hypothetical protein
LGARSSLRHGDGEPRDASAERYLAAEDRILKVSWKRLKLSAAELATLGALPLSVPDANRSVIMNSPPTGVTRGKKLVVLVGQKKAITIAVRNVSGCRRWSKLSEWLCPISCFATIRHALIIKQVFSAATKIIKFWINGSNLVIVVFLYDLP